MYPSNGTIFKVGFPRAHAKSKITSDMLWRFVKKNISRKNKNIPQEGMFTQKLTLIRNNVSMIIGNWAVVHFSVQNILWNWLRNNIGTIYDFIFESKMRLVLPTPAQRKNFEQKTIHKKSLIPPRSFRVFLPLGYDILYYKWRLGLSVWWSNYNLEMGKAERNYINQNPILLFVLSLSEVLCYRWKRYGLPATCRKIRKEYIYQAILFSK